MQAIFFLLAIHVSQTRRLKKKTERERGNTIKNSDNGPIMHMPCISTKTRYWGAPDS